MSMTWYEQLLIVGLGIFFFVIGQIAEAQKYQTKAKAPRVHARDRKRSAPNPYPPGLFASQHPATCALAHRTYMQNNPNLARALYGDLTDEELQKKSQEVGAAQALLNKERQAS